MEVRKKVDTIKVDFKCPKCNTGFLRPTGRVLTSYPPQYPHRCNNPECDYNETFSDKTYPHLDYEFDNSIQIRNGNTIDIIHGKGDSEFCTDKKEPFDNYARRPSGK
jgi:hypothetical protein